MDTSMWHASFFTYDAQGNPIRCEQIIYDSRSDFERRVGRLEKQQSVGYSYDSYGNWIETVIHEDGNVSKRLFRDITYYPDGYKKGEGLIPRHKLH